VLSEERLQEIMALKGTEFVQESVNFEFWHIIDGAFVMYDGNDPPPWVPRNSERDDDGLTRWGRKRKDQEQHAQK
jgi:hypothetical protein